MQTLQRGGSKRMKDMRPSGQLHIVHYIHSTSKTNIVDISD